MPSPDRVRDAARRADMVVDGKTGRILAAPEDLSWFERRGVNVNVVILDAPTDPVTAQLRDRALVQLRPEDRAARVGVRQVDADVPVEATRPDDRRVEMLDRVRRGG